MRRNSYMLKWYRDEIDYLLAIIQSKKPFHNYYEESLYEALEEYYYLKDLKERLIKDEKIFIR